MGNAPLVMHWPFGPEVGGPETVNLPAVLEEADPFSALLTTEYFLPERPSFVPCTAAGEKKCLLAGLIYYRSRTATRELNEVVR